MGRSIACYVLVIKTPEDGVARVGGPLTVVNASDVPALFVYSDDCVRPERADFGDEHGQLVGRDHVLSVKAD